MVSHTSQSSIQRAKSKICGLVESMNPNPVLWLWLWHPWTCEGIMQSWSAWDCTRMSMSSWCLDVWCLICHRKIRDFHWSGTMLISDLWEIWPLLTALVSFLICSTEDAGCKYCIIVIFFLLTSSWRCHCTLLLFLKSCTDPEASPKGIPSWARPILNYLIVWFLIAFKSYWCFSCVDCRLAVPLLDPMIFVVWNWNNI
jgi:hypothetical protein